MVQDKAAKVYLIREGQQQVKTRTKKTLLFFVCVYERVKFKENS